MLSVLQSAMSSGEPETDLIPASFVLDQLKKAEEIDQKRSKLEVEAARLSLAYKKCVRSVADVIKLQISERASTGRSLCSDMNESRNIAIKEALTAKGYFRIYWSESSSTKNAVTFSWSTKHDD